MTAQVATIQNGKRSFPFSVFHIVPFLDHATPILEQGRRDGGPVELTVPQADGAFVKVRFRNAAHAGQWVLELGRSVQTQIDLLAQAREAQERRNASMAAAGASPRSKVDHVIKDEDGEIIGMRTEYVY